MADLTDELRYAYVKGEIAVRVDVREVKLDLDRAIPCGLIINELVTNAFRYAFREQGGSSPLPRSDQQVIVSLCQENERIILNVSDNGVGLPDGLDIQAAKTLGLRLVNRLAGQLGGKLRVESAAHTAGGAVFQSVFPCFDGVLIDWVHAKNCP